MALEREPGSSRDRCPYCGGWIGTGHARGSDCHRLWPEKDANGEPFGKPRGWPKLDANGKPYGSQY